MNKKYVIGFIIGIITLLFSVPLGGVLGDYIIHSPSTILVAEEYIMLKEKVVISIQIIGGIVTLLSGIGITFRLK